MEKQEILQELNNIFHEIFQNKSIVLTENMSAADIDEWDSLNHAQLISAVEKHFNIKFKLSEMMGFKNVGSMCNVIHQKLA